MKICIVKLSAMGDIIHAMVTLQFIKKYYPNIQIDWIVEEAFKGILENNPHIDNILPVNLKSIKSNKLSIISQFKLLKQYSKNNYDLVIDAQGLIKSSIVSKIVGKKIVGFDKHSIRESLASKIYNKKVNIPYDQNVIDRNIKLVSEALDIEITKDDILNKEPFLYSKDIVDESSGLNIAFIVGASKPNKIYPKELLLEVANNLQDYNIDVVWSSSEEENIANFLEANAKNVKKLEKLTLDQLKIQIQRSSLIIGPDTGPTHMAWALNRPSITIFGPTPAYRNTYETDINKTIKSNTVVDPYNLDYDDYTINKIEPKDIANLVKELL